MCNGWDGQRETYGEHDRQGWGRIELTKGGHDKQGGMCRGKHGEITGRVGMGRVCKG